jgi:hypothetical protein
LRGKVRQEVAGEVGGPIGVQDLTRREETELLETALAGVEKRIEDCQRGHREGLDGEVLCPRRPPAVAVKVNGDDVVSKETSGFGGLLRFFSTPGRC